MVDSRPLLQTGKMKGMRLRRFGCCMVWMSLVSTPSNRSNAFKCIQMPQILQRNHGRNCCCISLQVSGALGHTGPLLPKFRHAHGTSWHMALWSSKWMPRLFSIDEEVRGTGCNLSCLRELSQWIVTKMLPKKWLRHPSKSVNVHLYIFIYLL